MQESKKKYLPGAAAMAKYILSFILMILTAAVILCNRYFINMPRWIGAVWMFAIFCLTVLLWTGKKKLTLTIIMTLTNLLALGAVFLGIFCNPYWNSLSFRENADFTCIPYGETISYEDARYDLDCAMNHLEQCHPLFLSGLSDDVQALYETACKNLKSRDKITANVLCREIQKILSSIGDGHTVAAAQFPEYHYLKYTYDHNQAGDRLVRINGQSLEEIFEDKKALLSYESERYGWARFKNYLSTAEDLNYLGFDPENGITFTYLTEEGKQVEVTYTREDFVTSEEYQAMHHLTDQAQESREPPFVRYEIIPECDLAVLTLDSCIDNAEYRQCLESMFREIKEKGIRNVCVDLRNNGGGNSNAANEFIRYLDIDTYRGWGLQQRLGPLMIEKEARTYQNQRHAELLFTGNVYALTSVFTYSSAMDFAMLLTDNHLGTIIGEASGNAADGYGENVKFKLPKSGLNMWVSTKKWYRVDQENPDPFIEPDVKCESSQAMEILKSICQKKAARSGT